MIADDWEAARVAPDASGLPGDVEWTQVSVPGRPAGFADADAVAYRTRVELDDRALLRLCGVYGEADVFVDGEQVASNDAYFEPVTVTLDGGGEREIVVVCRRPERFGGVFETDRVPAETAVPGVWWEASLEPVGDAAVADLRARPRLTDDRAVIDAAVRVVAGAEPPDRVRFSVRPEGFRGGGMMEQSRLEVEPGGRATVEVSIPVRDAKLWWPRGLGDQHRYAVRAKVGDESAEATTGFCDASYGDDGLTVNGAQVRARGFDLLPSENPTRDVERAVAAGANLVRVHAHVAQPALYDAADDAGVLVWQDLPLTGDGGFDVERGRAVAAGVADATANHPSVAVFAVHDDPVDVTDGLAGASLARWRLRWRAWRASYDRSGAAAVADALPDRPTFPVVGGPGVDADATAAYPGWRFGDADEVRWLLDWQPDAGDVVTAFGAGALADANGADAAGFDADAHAAHVSDGDVPASQAYQARVAKTVAERLRRDGSDVIATFALRDADDGAGMGVFARDGTPKAARDAVAASFEPVQAMLDAWPKAGGSVGATVVNDAPDAVTGTLSWTAGEASGKATVEVPAFGRADAGEVSVPADAAQVSLALDVGDGSVTNEYRVE
jgi:hypothetical protein